MTLSRREIFTPSEANLRSNIQNVNARGLLVVGSVGRAAIFQSITGCAMLELNRRGEQPLVASHIVYRQGVPRDIDIIGGKAPDKEMPPPYPHHIDDRGFYNQNIQFSKTATGWQLSIDPTRDHPFTHQLDPVMFDPVHSETILGIPCDTVRAATHYALLQSRSQRPNDQLAQELLMQVMPEAEKDLLQSQPYLDLCNYLRTN